MNLLEIFWVIILLYLTVAFWANVFSDEEEAKSVRGVAFCITGVLWLITIYYYIDFFTSPLW